MRKPDAAKATPEAQDLRQRAARARDAAGRFIKRAAVEGASPPNADLPAAGNPDAMAAWRTACREHSIRTAPLNECPELMRSNGEVWSTQSLMRAMETGQITVDEYARLHPLASERELRLAEIAHGLNLGSLFALAYADEYPLGQPNAGLVEASSETDPAFAAIEAHRSAFEEYEQLASVANDLPSADPGYRAAALAAEELGRREIATYQTLFGAKPTTLAGTASLAAYMCDAVRAAQIDDKPSDGERALRTIAEALSRLGRDTDAAVLPDAALVALGAEFMAAWAAEDAVDDNEAEYLACTRLAEQIARSPAGTVAGLGIKALLLARLDSEDSGPRRPISAQGPLASHWNVLRQIQQGAGRLAAGEVASAIPTASVKPELSALTVVELARLYPVLVRAEQVLGSAENAPCFYDKRRTDRTTAGHILNWEARRLQQLSSDVAAEISRRQPDNPDDQAERANTILTHMVLTGGVEEHPEVLFEICATWGSIR